MQFSQNSIPKTLVFSYVRRLQKYEWYHPSKTIFYSYPVAPILTYKKTYCKI